MLKTNTLLWLGLVSATLLSAQDKPRVFVSSSESVEIIRNFRRYCPEVTITSDRSKADFAVVFDLQGGTASLRRLNKFAVFDKNGDLIFTGSTRTPGNAFKDACEAIQKAR